MSGHSKWSTIKRKKEKTDSARAKIFTKIGREIQVCVKEGGGDPGSNGKLRDIIAKAKSLNVPSDNINRLIQKASGDKANYQPARYEGYGPCGLAFIVDALTDNLNRTGANMRLYFDKYGAGLGNSGCTSYLFERKGVIIISSDLPNVEEVILGAPIEDYVSEEDFFEITVAPADFSDAVTFFGENNIPIDSAEITFVASTTVTVDGEDDQKKLEQLIFALDEDEDVQDYSTNLG